MVVNYENKKIKALLLFSITMFGKIKK